MNGDLPAPWLDAEGRFFNPRPQIQWLALGAGQRCAVVDSVLANPEGVRAWAATLPFAPPAGFPYPGRVAALPALLNARFGEFFSQHLRGALGGRRVLDVNGRASVIDTPPEQLAPVQWQCHRDRLQPEPGGPLFAASVLYLFHDTTLGGTSFYTPRVEAAQIDRMVMDSQVLDAGSFGQRYGLSAGYMDGSNAYFERTLSVPAAWNRLIVYDGCLFHSADVNPVRLHGAPLQGRLTLNAFITCSRAAA